jgi:fatty-acyl-CoA synthase
MTETGVLASLTNANDKNVSEKFAYESIGRVIPFLEQKIVDPNTGRIVPINEPGEMCFRGFNIMRGYLEDTEKNAESFDSSG